MPVRIWRIVPHALLVPALQIGHPFQTLVQMIVHDFARLSCGLSLKRFHEGTTLRAFYALYSFACQKPWRVADVIRAISF
jgi:hypothetical protein